MSDEQIPDPTDAEPAGQGDDPATPDDAVTDAPPVVDGPPRPVAAKSHRLAGRSRWAIAAAAVAVLGIGAAAAAAAAFSEFDGGHGRSERGYERSQGLGQSCGQEQSPESDAESDDDRMNTCRENAQPVGRRQIPAVAGPSDSGGLDDPNGPIVIEPTTPGGARTVVWPDGRIVTIPADSSATTSTTTP